MGTMMNTESDDWTGLERCRLRRAAHRGFAEFSLVMLWVPWLFVNAAAAQAPAGSLGAHDSNLAAIELEDVGPLLEGPTFAKALAALASWGRSHAAIPADSPVTPGGRPTQASLGESELCGRRLLTDVLTLASVAEPEEWSEEEPVRALREASVSAGRAFRESLVLSLIELSQMAPLEPQRDRHLRLAARLAESLCHAPNLPGIPASEAMALGSMALGAEAPRGAGRGLLGTPEEWRGVVERIHAQLSSASAGAAVSIPLGGVTGVGGRLGALMPGKAAPRFVARDTAGNEIRSTDFHGKVVLYRFWSDRSPASIAAHEQDLALLRHFWDTPFELVGISADPSREGHLKVLADAQLGGTQIYDGPISTKLVDALARAGHASRTIPTSSMASWGFPTIGTSILVDSRGVIRAHDLHGAALFEAIEHLVAEHRIRLREQRLTHPLGD